MKKVIGIDLGTTNSVVAFKTRSAEVLRNRENEELTPSCVGWRNSEILVGKTAYSLIHTDPQNTILSVKRLMGAAFNEGNVQKMIADSREVRSYYKYSIVQLQGGTEDATAVLLGGKQYTPEQISAEILKKIKADAEDKIGEVTHAVITVPAYFTEKQKNATKLAAKYAGIKVLKILAEPTAAAIAYGVDELKAGEAKTVLIYDFGGGTFDLSVLNIIDGQFLEMGTGGDRWLGGDDLDKSLSEYIYKQVCQKYNIDFKTIDRLIENLNSRKKSKFLGLIRKMIEDTKIQLSSSQSADFYIEDLLEDENGNPIDIYMKITRQEFEKIIRPYIERSIDLIDELLQKMNYEIDMIDHILMVGGSSCIPLVKEILIAKFGKEKVLASKKPMLAVAEGAAILAHRLDSSYELDPEDTTPIEGVTFTTAHDYFIKINVNGEDKYDRIIEKQMPLPATASKQYKTTTDKQRLISIDIQTDVENGKYEQCAIGFYLIENEVPIGTDFIFDFELGLDNCDEILSVTVYPLGQKTKAKKVIMGRTGADEKALGTINKLVYSGVRETKTAEAEQKIMDLVAKKVSEIEKKGEGNITTEKWHEIYYTTTEEYNQIINTEDEGFSVKDRILYFAKRLVAEFRTLINPADLQTILTLVSRLETGDGDEDELIRKLEEKVLSDYGKLDSVLDIEPFAERILGMPSTDVGVATKKQNDAQRLIELCHQIKNNFLTQQGQEAVALLQEARQIMNIYQNIL